MPGFNDENTIHYVKFLRGSITAWERLKQTPEKIDDDTLYFIYASVNNPTKGKLYLGQKLISGSEEFSGDINISNLEDVLIDNSLETKDILIYDQNLSKWINAPITEIINNEISIMEGATEDKDGISGLVPTPTRTDYNKFLRGDGSWQSLQFDDNIFTQNTDPLSILGFTAAPIGSIPIKTNDGIQWSSNFTGTLNRQIINMENLQILLESDLTFNPNTIFMVPNGNDESSNNRYDEYMIIDGKLEFLGTFGQVNLTNYVTVTRFDEVISDLENILNDIEDPETHLKQLGLISRVSYLEITNNILQTKIGDLNSLFTSEENKSETLVEEVNIINERLKWHDLKNE